MVEKEILRYCESCNKETLQLASEDALEINYHCKECDTDENVIKSFF